MSVILIEARNGDKVTARTYLQANHALLRVGEKIVNYRTCAEITGVNADSAKANVEQLVGAFLS